MKKKQSSKLGSLLVLISACGGTEDSESSTNTSNTEDQNNNTSNLGEVTPTSNYYNLKSKDAFIGTAGVNDIISGTGDSFTTGTSIIDPSTYDADELNIIASTDITDLPIVSGIEEIVFQISADTIGGDTVFTVDTNNISDYKLIKFENLNSDSQTKTLDVRNISDKLEVNSNFNSIKISGETESELDLSVFSDSNIETSSSLKDLYIDSNGKNISLVTTATDDINIDNANTVELSSSSAKGNVNITANGDVSVSSLPALKGNINITGVGKIDLGNVTEASGFLQLNNERATFGTDITLTNVNTFAIADITSAGSVTAISNSGLASASILSITMAENSNITADNVENQKITLNSSNPLGDSITVNLQSSTVENLILGGSSPLIVELDGADISTETVTSTNANASLKLEAFDTDLTSIASNVNIWLGNHDGKTLKVKEGQTLYFDTEESQTASSSVPKINHVTDATSSTTNTMTLKTIDTNTANGDVIANISGLHLIDVQTLTFNLDSSLELNSTGNITGTDLTKVEVKGSGKFDLNSSTLSGSSSTRMTFDGSTSTGSISLQIDSTVDGVANVKTGSANDTVLVSGITSDSAGFVIQTNAGNDLIEITTGADGTSSKININAGDGTSDKLLLQPGVDLSGGNITLSSIEKIAIQGGGTTQKMAASDLSGQSFSLSETGVGTGTFTVVPDQATVNLGSLVFESSFADGTDLIVIDGSSSSTGISATGTSIKDQITGSNANDTLVGGTGNDVISGGTGDDTIEGQNGADSLTGGAGDDEFDFAALASTEENMDKITDYQAAAADAHNDKIDNTTGAKGTNTSSIDVKSAISGGGGGETVTASVSNGIVTLSGSDKGLINTLAEWIDAVSVDGVIAKAGDDADAIGTVAFELSGNTYIVESNDTFDNNTPNVSIISVIELTGLTGVTAIADAAAANTILVA